MGDLVSVFPVARHEGGKIGQRIGTCGVGDAGIQGDAKDVGSG